MGRNILRAPGHNKITLASPSSSTWNLKRQTAAAKTRRYRYHHGAVLFSSIADGRKKTRDNDDAWSPRISSPLAFISGSLWIPTAKLTFPQRDLLPEPARCFTGPGKRSSYLFASNYIDDDDEECRLQKIYEQAQKEDSEWYQQTFSTFLDAGDMAIPECGGRESDNFAEKGQDDRKSSEESQTDDNNEDARMLLGNDSAVDHPNEAQHVREENPKAKLVGRVDDDDDLKEVDKTDVNTDEMQYSSSVGSEKNNDDEPISKYQQSPEQEPQGIEKAEEYQPRSEDTSQPSQDAKSLLKNEMADGESAKHNNHASVRKKKYYDDDYDYEDLDEDAGVDGVRGTEKPQKQETQITAGDKRRQFTTEPPPGSATTSSTVTSTNPSPSATKIVRLYNRQTTESVPLSPLSALLDLGYTEREVVVLKPQVLELIVEDSIKRPDKGLPKRWVRLGRVVGYQLNQEEEIEGDEDDDWEVEIVKKKKVDFKEEKKLGLYDVEEDEEEEQSWDEQTSGLPTKADEGDEEGNARSKTTARENARQTINEAAEEIDDVANYRSNRGYEGAERDGNTLRKERQRSRRLSTPPSPRRTRQKRSRSDYENDYSDGSPQEQQRSRNDNLQQRQRRRKQRQRSPSTRMLVVEKSEFQQPAPLGASNKFWMDLPTFQGFLREEARFRLRVLGPDWKDGVLQESRWRFDLYKKWLTMLEEGVGGEPLYEYTREERRRGGGTGRRSPRQEQHQQEQRMRGETGSKSGSRNISEKERRNSVVTQPGAGARRQMQQDEDERVYAEPKQRQRQQGKRMGQNLEEEEEDDIFFSPPPPPQRRTTRSAMPRTSRRRRERVEYDARDYDDKEPPQLRRTRASRNNGSSLENISDVEDWVKSASDSSSSRWEDDFRSETNRKISLSSRREEGYDNYIDEERED